MKNILFIDTSKNFCKIGFFYDNKIIEKTKLSTKNHLKYILPILDNLLKKNNLKINNFNIISYIDKPNNLISNKIGISISKGLSVGLKISTIKLSYFELISERIYQKTNIVKNILIIINNSHHSFFWAICERDNNKNWKIIINNSKIDIILNYIEKTNSYIYYQTYIEKDKKKYINKSLIKYTNFISYKIIDVINVIKNKINFL